MPPVCQCQGSSNAVICDSLSVPDSPAEKHVVIAVRIERRVEVDQIDILVLDVVAQDLEIVTVVKRIHGMLWSRRIAFCFRNSFRR